MRQAAALFAVVGQCGLVLLSCGCQGPGPEADAEAADVADAPLGWGGPVDSEEVRVWSRESLDAAPRWRVAPDPDYAMVLDSVELIVGEHVIKVERFVAKGVFLPEGRVALLSRTGSQPESPLLYLIDRESGHAAGVQAPDGEAGESLNWGSFTMATTVAQGFVLVGDNVDYRESRRRMRRTGLDVWYADRNGRFTRPPSYVEVDGGLLGTFADGSLAMWTSPEIGDTTIVTEIVSPRVTEGPSRLAGGQQAELLFRMANPKDPDRFDIPANWAA